MKLKLFYDGETVTVTSERAAKAWARQALGAKKLKETPSQNGWQYWDSTDDDEMSENAVTVVVLGR